MRRITALIVALALLTVTLSVGLAGTSSAQTIPENPVTNDTENQTEQQTNARFIDENTRVLSVNYNEEEETATLVFESDTAQAITLADAGYLSEGQSGQIPRKSRAINGQGSITIPVTQVDGMVAVSISTEQVLYGLVIEPRTQSIWERTNSRDGWLGGVSVTIVMGTLAAYRVKNNDPDSPEEPE
ncbi:hypothetical protein [Haloarcula halophila]|uniref:hypothetical protein n=1 Tax=Haloarcula TaxID=2237 RepID=UPI0023E36D9D|nr:hypothetical protein [Halomicroarcula sp. DFY41]